MRGVSWAGEGEVVAQALGSMRPHVVGVGGGFGRLYAARALAGQPVRVTLLALESKDAFGVYSDPETSAVLEDNPIRRTAE
jgi:NADPH-dependent 2,4-dienoyl-CoA reductase/sulfur reductase-like enzyme